MERVLQGMTDELKLSCEMLTELPTPQSSDNQKASFVDKFIKKFGE